MFFLNFTRFYLDQTNWLFVYFCLFLPGSNLSLTYFCFNFTRFYLDQTFANWLFVYLAYSYLVQTCYLFLFKILPVSIWIKLLPIGCLFIWLVPTWFKPLSVSSIFHFACCYLNQTFVINFFSILSVFTWIKHLSVAFFLSPFWSFVPGSNLCQLHFYAH